ncbi:MAG: hypothetical protein Q8P18_15985 [Pseudomonadota bacterium]|nr:hypothetical protein [Pseudomonadota bacterium]
MASYWFTILSSLLVAGGLAVWVGRAVDDARLRAAAWMGIVAQLAWTAAVGATGIVSDFSRVPPPLALFFLGLFLVVGLATLSPLGRRLADATPLRFLIGMQAFRVLPELLLHLAWKDGLAPIRLTVHGRNVDIVTVLVAAALALAWPRLRSRRAWAWGFTALGLALLANVVVTAVLSLPTPFQVFVNERPNVFVTTFPYVWLPGFLVFTALLLHAVTLRRLVRGHVD